jgi:hypothetical protein
VVAITAPIMVAWLLAGPAFGILAAGIVAGALVFVAIRLSMEPPRRRRFTRSGTREPKDQAERSRVRRNR